MHASKSLGNGKGGITAVLITYCCGVLASPPVTRAALPSLPPYVHAWQKQKPSLRRVVFPFYNAKNPTHAISYSLLLCAASNLLSSNS